MGCDDRKGSRTHQPCCQGRRSMHWGWLVLMHGLMNALDGVKHNGFAFWPQVVEDFMVQRRSKACT